MTTTTTQPRTNLLGTTLDDILEKVREVLIERGEDYVYDDKNEDGECLYSKDGTTGSCVYGVVLLEKLHVDHAVITEGVPINNILRALGVSDPWTTIAAAKRMVIDLVQYRQDRGDPYGEILKYLDNRLAAIAAGQVW